VPKISLHCGDSSDQQFGSPQTLMACPQSQVLSSPKNWEGESLVTFIRKAVNFWYLNLVVFNNQIANKTLERVINLKVFAFTSVLRSVDRCAVGPLVWTCHPLCFWIRLLIIAFITNWEYPLFMTWMMIHRFSCSNLPRSLLPPHF